MATYDALDVPAVCCICINMEANNMESISYLDGWFRLVSWLDDDGNQSVIDDIDLTSSPEEWRIGRQAISETPCNIDAGCDI